jgi:hypothetical protein
MKVIICMGGKERINLNKLLSEIGSDPEVRKALFKVLKRSGIENPKKLKVRVEIQEDMGGVRGAAYGALRFLGELNPYVSLAIKLDLDGVVDSLVPNNEVAGQIKSVLGNISGRSNSVLIEVFRTPESGRKNKKT